MILFFSGLFFIIGVLIVSFGGALESFPTVLLGANCLFASILFYIVYQIFNFYDWIVGKLNSNKRF